MNKSGRVKAVLPRTKYSNLVTDISVIACYDMLRTVYPFCDWDLPDEVEVTVLDDITAYGEFVEPNEINISKALVWDINDLMRTVAHEMIHLKQHRLGKFDENDPHDKLFWRMAREVCLSVGWKQEGF